MYNLSMILILKHIDIEGPGTLGEFLKARKEPFKIIELGAGEPLPADVSEFKAVIVLGGPMNVDEETTHPFLKAENAFIQETLKQEVPYLGICLGSQLLAKAAGAKVTKSPAKEIGWYHVKLTGAGKNDPLFKGFREDETIFHWHEDMFEIPSDGQLLATSSGCPHQALKVGRNAYGLQFHVEITDVSIKEWCAEYCRKNTEERVAKSCELMEGYTKYKDQFNRQANRLFENFLDLCYASR
jgi:GMP synthase (glutamine-hydrolysing)